MAIQGIGQSQQTTSSGVQNAASNNALDKSQFLSLLLAQIENQDPLNPQDSAEFTTQLAQITSVENLESINKQFSGLTSSLQLSQSLSAQALIGEKVMVPGSQMTVEANGKLAGDVQLAKDSQGLTLNIYDSNKVLVDQVQLGAVKAGNIAFSTKELAAGTYTITGTALVDGQQYNVPVSLMDTVKSVTIPGNGQQSKITLAGMGTVPLSSIKQIGQ